MLNCPSVELLDAYYADQLDAASSQRIEVHFRRCARCRSASGDLVGGRGLSKHLRALHSDSSLAPKSRCAAHEPMPEFAGYVAQEELSRGGQGIVYRALQQGTRREVAIKMPLGGVHASRDTQRRFQREIEVLARLRHPGIVTIFDSGMTADGLPYYVMDYVRGRPVDQHIRAHELSLEATLDLFAKLCEPIVSAHECGIVHRDLKPSNILVEENGDLKVLDFGLAKLLVAPSDLSQSSRPLLMGTLPFIAPELVRGEPIDKRADVYALGVMLYRQLTGMFPVQLDVEPAAAIQRIANARPIRPTHAWRQVHGAGERCPIDADLETLLLVALEGDPAERYASVRAFADGIECYRQHRPLPGRRGWPYRVRKLARRHRGVMAVCAVMALLAGFGASAAVVARSADQRARIEQANRLHSEAKLVSHTDPDAAREKFRRAIGLHRDPLAIEIDYAYFLRRQREFEQATELCEKVLSDHAECGPAHLLLAVMLQHDHPDAAERHRAAARRSESDDRYYLALSIETTNPSEAIGLLTELLDEDGMHIDARLARASIYLREGDIGAMLLDAERLVAMVPNAAIAWNTLGLALSRQMRFPEAIKAYSRAVTLAPRHHPFYLNRAESHTMNGDCAAAIADCDEAIRLGAEAAAVFFLRGRARALMSDHSAGRRDLETALELDPGHASAYRWLGRTLAVFGEEEAAIEAYGRSIELASDPTKAYFERGKIRLARAEFEAARGDFSEVITRSPSEWSAWLHRAQTNRRLSRLDDSEADCTHVIENNPDAAQAHYERGLVRWLQGRYADALPDFQRAVDLEQSGQTRMALAAAHLLADDHDGALGELARVIEKHPEFAFPARLWTWQMRVLGGDSEGADQLLAALSDLVTDGLDASLLAILKGEQADDEWLAQAGDDPAKQCVAYYYLSIRAELDADAEQVVRHLDACLATAATDQPEYHLARWRRSQSSWPRTSRRNRHGDRDSTSVEDARAGAPYVTSMTSSERLSPE